jgi:hypothetical protein
MLEGWQLNSIVTLQSGAHWGMLDTGDDYSGTNETSNVPAALGEHWDFFGKTNDFKGGNSSIPYCTGDFTNAASIAATVSCTQSTPARQVTFGAGSAQAVAFGTACSNAAIAIGALASLNGTTNGGPGGCFAQKNSVMIPPVFGTFGTAGRNIFPSQIFPNVDMSVYKDWKFKERLTFQFRAEVFNLFNHPNFANPGGGPNGFNHNDPSVPGQFGCGCATPDVAGENPVLGSGSNRAVQLGLKIIF